MDAKPKMGSNGIQPGFVDGQQVWGNKIRNEDVESSENSSISGSTLL